MIRAISIDRASWSKPLRGSAAAINGRPWTAAIGMPAIRRPIFVDDYAGQIQPQRGFPAAINGFVPVIVQVGGGRNTRYTTLDRLIISKALRGSSAAINGSGIVTGITADVMCGMDTYAWPEQETQWWSPPLKSFSAAVNAFVPFVPAVNPVGGKFKTWWDVYQEQNQPLRAFTAAVQAFPVYNFALDSVRAKQSKYTDEYFQQLQILKGFTAAINGNPAPPIPPTYTAGPRYIILLPPRAFTISAITMQQFNVKDPAESVMLTFNLAPDLTSGEVLSGTPTVTVSVVQGVDTNPQAIVTGLAGFDSTQSQVVVPVSGGLSGVFYELQVTCATSNFQKRLSLAGVLPVRSIL